ncbi:hypothetical protein M8C21_017414 [Ambrosia artemisiifolia]|uniref:Ubiquitin-like domain-containing protein n=1 Tax=Ambrosia artemisiifolia TaxID=4212 RepID=A0AAD5G6Q3_AMBAR|nr:hypothetical protein M8C21_017414 [Ambrosia artemisiifolia]
MSAGDQGVQINLKVKAECGNEVFFKMKRSTQLKRLINTYCDVQSIELNSVAFLFDGRRLLGEHTPHQLEMEDGDAIDAMLHLTGEWSTYEEAALARAWIDVSEVGDTGNTDAFWRRASNHFHAVMRREEYRMHHQLNSKWRDLRPKLRRFNIIYNNLYNNMDLNEVDLLDTAHDQYCMENDDTFDHMAAWRVVKDHPSFCSET